MKSTATTPEEYIASCETKRAEVITKLRSLIRDNLPAGYEESTRWGMLTYEVPLSLYPDTNNKQPMMYAGLANQKNYISLHLLSPRFIPEHEELLNRSGKKLKRGNGCINFLSLDELPLEDLKEIIQKSDIQSFISEVKKGLQESKAKRAAEKEKSVAKPAAKKPAAKAAPKQAPKPAVKKSAPKAAAKKESAAKKKSVAKPAVKKPAAKPTKKAAAKAAPKSVAKPVAKKSTPKPAKPAKKAAPKAAPKKSAAKPATKKKPTKKK